jgi:hypothetical protein
LLNRATGQYSSSIRALLLHLFTTYGHITPQQVKAKEMELLNMHYDISQPVDNVFNSIDDLSDLAESVNSPMSSQQMINLAYVIFAKQTILQPDLRLWNRKPVAECTWDHMMEHLHDAQSNLSSLPTTGDMYHQEPPPHQANITTMAELIAQCLLDDQHHMPPAYAPPVPTPTLLESPPAPPYTDMANILERRETDLQSREASMMTRMQEMMTIMHSGNNNTNNGNTRGNTRNNRGRGGGRTAGRTNNRTHPTCAYCWTHGACVHTSVDCNSTPANGHQATTTFANMQNSSKEGCYWLT